MRGPSLRPWSIITVALSSAARDAFSVFEGLRYETDNVRNSYNSRTSSRLGSRADQECTHEPLISSSGKVGLSYPPPILHPVHHQLSSNHFHIHSIPSSFSNHNTTSSPHSSNHTPTRSAPLSRSTSATSSVLCSCDSPLRSRRRPKSSHATHQTL